MRSSWTAFALAFSACLPGTSAYADSHSRPMVATPHAQAPKPNAKPTTPGGSRSTSLPTHGTKSGTASSSALPSSTSTSTPPHTPIRLNPIAAKIASKPQLNARITAMLPKGMTLNQASRGFKNQGQFIAALHVSQNLGCDCFRQIKTDMTRKHMSLGRSIQDVKKTANTTVEVHRAESEADRDVKSTVTTTTATSTSTASGTQTTKKTTKKTTAGDTDR